MTSKLLPGVVSEESEKNWNKGKNGKSGNTVYGLSMPSSKKQTGVTVKISILVVESWQTCHFLGNFIAFIMLISNLEQRFTFSGKGGNKLIFG